MWWRRVWRVERGRAWRGDAREAGDERLVVAQTEVAVRVELAGIEATEPDDVPEAAAQIARHAVATCRSERDPGVAHGVERREALGAIDVPEAHRAVVGTRRKEPSVRGLKATLITVPVCPRSLAGGVPVSTSHTRTVASYDPVARRLPSGLNVTLATTSVCPWKWAIEAPVVRFQIRAVVSYDPVARRVPSGLNAMLATKLVCPWRMAMEVPVVRFQIRAVASHDPVARHVPSGLNATLVTLSVCPWRRAIEMPAATSHTRAVPSHDPVARHVPCGLKATLATASVWPW